MRKLLLIFLTCCFLAWLSGCSDGDALDESRSATIIADILNRVHEVDSRFCISKTGIIYFSKNVNGHYNLFKFDIARDSAARQISNKTDIFSPFFYSDSVLGITDTNGNQMFSCTGPNGVSNTKWRPIKWINSFSDGKYVIFQKQNSDEVNLFDTQSGTLSLVTTVSRTFHGFSFSPDEERLLVSYDNYLKIIDLKSGRSNMIGDSLEFEKLNPHLVGSKIYFASNHESEFYQIYCLDIHSRHMSVISASGTTDLRMPQRRGNFLYFIEIDRSQYLLRKIDLISKEEHTLTEKGVVYEYVVLSDSTIAATWSDLDTPKSMIILNTRTQAMRNISGETLNLGLSDVFMDSVARAPGYCLLPPLNTGVSGVILFLHPGISSDYSPRWETTLNVLCKVGYVVVAPNYLMSSGYGKTFHNANIGESVADIIKWKKWALKSYPKLPVFLVASSSGNILMEQVLHTDNRGVEGVVSLFGIPSAYPPYIKTRMKVFLGKSDPLVKCDARVRELTSSGIEETDIHVFEDEGHWIRRAPNSKKVIEELLVFLKMKGS